MHNVDLNKEIIHVFVQHETLVHLFVYVSLNFYYILNELDQIFVIYMKQKIELIVMEKIDRIN